GELVAAYLGGDAAAQDYMESVDRQRAAFPGFNLLVGDAGGVHFVSSREGVRPALPPGVYGLSNASLDSPWPKVEAGKRRVREALARASGPHRLTQDLLPPLADRELAADDPLPQTRTSHAREKRRSSAFIVAPEYGTRASTVLLVDREGEVHFRERSFGAGGEMAEDRRYRFVAG